MHTKVLRTKQQEFKSCKVSEAISYCGYEHESSYFYILVLPFINCMTLRKLFNLSSSLNVLIYKTGMMITVPTL